MRPESELRKRHKDYLKRCNHALAVGDLVNAERFLAYANIIRWAIGFNKPTITVGTPPAARVTSPCPVPGGHLSPAGAGTSIHDECFIECGPGAIPFENQWVM